MHGRAARTKQGTIIREKAAQLQAAEVLRLKAASAPAASAPAPAPAVGASAVTKLRTSESDGSAHGMHPRIHDVILHFVSFAVCVGD